MVWGAIVFEKLAYVIMSLSRSRDKRITSSSITRPSSNCGHRENHEHGTPRIFRNIARHPGVTKCCNSYEKNMLN